MSVHLENALSNLKGKLLTLSSMVEKSCQQAVRSVKDRNIEMAQQVIDEDDKIDLFEVEVEEDCLKILALYQPVAIDLRIVISCLKINNDLERIGDLAKNISSKSIFISQNDPIEFPFDFKGMTTQTALMLNNALKSFVDMNPKLAKEVCEADSEVDKIHYNMYKRIYKELKKEPDNEVHAELLVGYLSISRSLERIADYTTNIAEDVIYMVEGKIIRHNRDIEV